MPPKNGGIYGGNAPKKIIFRPLKVQPYGLALLAGAGATMASLYFPSLPSQILGKFPNFDRFSDSKFTCIITVSLVTCFFDTDFGSKDLSKEPSAQGFVFSWRRMLFEWALPAKLALLFHVGMLRRNCQHALPVTSILTYFSSHPGNNWQVGKRQKRDEKNCNGVSSRLKQSP